MTDYKGVKLIDNRYYCYVATFKNMVSCLQACNIGLTSPTEHRSSSSFNCLVNCILECIFSITSISINRSSSSFYIYSLLNNQKNCYSCAQCAILNQSCKLANMIPSLYRLTELIGCRCHYTIFSEQCANSTQRSCVV